MGSNERTSVDSVIEQLLNHPEAFNIFQAICLLEREVARQGWSDKWNAMQLRAHVSLAFEASDIRHIRRSEAEAPVFTLSTAVLSLAGAGGALPLVFTEMLLSRKAKRDHAMGDFLDIFNQRLLQFLYASRCKIHPALSSRPSSSQQIRMLDSIASLGIAKPIPHSPAMWLKHSGLLGGAPRSMTGLLALLKDRLGLRLKGRQFVGQWLSLEHSELVRLDGTAALGGTCVLGKRVWDQAAGIELKLESLGQDQLQSCLPGGNAYRLLQLLIPAYLRQELDVSLVLQSVEKGSEGPRLKKNNGLRLGWTTWLTTGHAARPEPVRLKLQSSNYLMT